MILYDIEPTSIKRLLFLRELDAHRRHVGEIVYVTPEVLKQQYDIDLQTIQSVLSDLEELGHIEIEQTPNRKLTCEKKIRKDDEQDYYLITLNDSFTSYYKAYGQNVMSERHYKDILYGLNENYEAVVAEISTLEDEMANQKLITIEQYFEGIVKRVENLNFTENKAIIKKAIVRIVATKQDISIWERIPLLATPNGGTISNNESSIYANHLENEREVGLNVEHWYCGVTKCW